jgi:ketosteroid isomerase-like protein
MPDENIKVVRAFNDPYEGEDVMPAIRAAVARFGPDPDPAVVLRWWADDPGWRHAHVELEWDTTSIPGLGTKVRGPAEISLWWRDWTEAWERYVYRTAEYRDLDRAVFTKTSVEAEAAGGLPVRMTVFQLWRVREGKVASCRVFMSEGEALEAAGFSD